MELIEREIQLASLRACLERAAGGAGNIALVSGEAGIGKTSLLREMAAHFDNLWWGACDALQTPEPLAPLHDIARATGAKFGQSLAAGVSGTALFREALAELESSQPTLVVIEDAHWADASTLDFIRFAGRRLDRTHALMVVTFRQDEITLSHPLRPVIGELPAGITTRIELQGLSPEAVQALARRALRSPAGLHDTTGGNPFFLTELLRHGIDEVPRSVQDLVLARFARLPAHAREIVQLASIVPARIERRLVDEVLAPDAESLEACFASGLLLADKEALFFRHELARVAVEHALSPPLAESLHRRALAALKNRSDLDIHPARGLHHAVRAGANDEILLLAPLAARQALKHGSRREAVAHYRAMLELDHLLPEEELLRTLEAYAAQCHTLSYLSEAIAARRRIEAILARRGDVLAEARNLSILSLVLVLALRNKEADEANQRAITLAEAHPPGLELANVYRVEAQLRMLNRDCAEAMAWAGKAIAIAEPLGDKWIVANARTSSAAANLFIDWEAGRRELVETIDFALANNFEPIAANGYLNLGSAAGELVRFADAESYLLQAIEFCARRELDFFRTYSLAWLGRVQFLNGRWEEAESCALESLEAGTESSTARVMALATLGSMQARRGDADAAKLLDEAGALADASATLQRLAPVKIARAEAALLAGDVEAARAEVPEALALAMKQLHRWYTGELALLAKRAGLETPPPEACARPHADELRGDWRVAAHGWKELGCPYERARALAQGDASAQREALAIFEHLGAKPAAAGVRLAMREAGVRGVPRGPRASTQKNARGLTARELQILELLVEGLRNSEIAERLFRSVRTVEHHVDSLLGKLGAHSRAEAAVLARREGLVPNLGSETPKSP